jgi:hypothetical protein
MGAKAFFLGVFMKYPRPGQERPPSMMGGKLVTTRHGDLRRMADHLTRHSRFADFLYLGLILTACLVSSILWFDSLGGGATPAEITNQLNSGEIIVP